MENELTKKLIAEGFTPENPPPYAKWDKNWRCFEYTLAAARELVWETPCGLLRKGKDIDACGWGSHEGVTYMPENNNLRIGCPYFDDIPCQHRIGKLMGWNCITHRTDRPYDYNHSVEKIMDKEEKIQHAAWLEVARGYGWCANMCYDRKKRKYVPQFDVMACIQNRCKNEICAITKQPRDVKKLVNVFYDLLRERRYKEKGGLFEHTERTLEKDVKHFDRSVPRCDAEIWLKKHGDAFPLRLAADDRRLLTVSEHFGKTGWGAYEYYEFKITPLNIRIEHREHRDLEQDLADIRDGIKVVHASDIKKRKAEEKRERRAKRQEVKQKKSGTQHG